MKKKKVCAKTGAAEENVNSIPKKKKYEGKGAKARAWARRISSLLTRPPAQGGSAGAGDTALATPGCGYAAYLRHFVGGCANMTALGDSRRDPTTSYH
jgi:hypothetical protein